MTPRLSLFLVLIQAGLAPLAAQPAGGRITAGTGSLASAGGLTQVNQTSDRMIVDWNSFSIPAGATVNFNQPRALSAVLNRVTGADASAIFGTLSANGRVYLLNPNGVLIGPSGRVQTAGFVAATTHLSDQDFLRGTGLNLTGGTDASVVNRGRVSALPATSSSWRGGWRTTGCSPRQAERCSSSAGLKYCS
jgi:filamentous hemagglutinin family protein